MVVSRILGAALMSVALIGCEAGSSFPATPPGMSGGPGPKGGGSATTSSSAGSGGVGGGTDTEFSCGEVELALRVRPPNVVLAVDRSGSMGHLWDHDANAGTADIVRAQLVQGAVETLVDAFDSEMHLGGMLFPGPSSETGCTLDADLGAPLQAGGGASVLALLSDPAAEPDGGTPTAWAIAAAADALAAEPDDEPGVIVLITDGIPSCGQTPADATAAAAKARGEGVLTFAVGVGVDPAYAPAFDQLVAAGGGGVFLNETNEEGLVQALGAVALDAVRCRVPIATPKSAEDLEVFLDGAALAAVSNCDENDAGWAFVDPNGPLNSLEICAGTCAALTERSELLAVYACEPATPGP